MPPSLYSPIFHVTLARGKITRPAHITVNFFNEHGKEAAIEAYGFYAGSLLSTSGCVCVCVCVCVCLCFVCLCLLCHVGVFLVVVVFQRKCLT